MTGRAREPRRYLAALAGFSPRLLAGRFRLGEVVLHDGADEIFQRTLVDLVAFVDVDRP
jgi:hypothetical protein